MICSWQYRRKVTFQEMCHPALFSWEAANSSDPSSTHQPELDSKLWKPWGRAARRRWPCTG